MANEGILGSYWTTAGPAFPEPLWSPFGWEDRCAQAARVGLVGLGLWHDDVRHLLETCSLADLGAVFDDAGLEYLEVEFPTNWFLPASDPRRAAAEETTRLVFEAAAALGAHHVKAGNLYGTPVGRDELVDAFGALCATAADMHDAPVVYELMPHDPNVHSIDAACALVTDAGAPNGGLALDTYHLGKLGVEASELAAVPTRFPLYVELSDGNVANMADRSEETTSHRHLPGEGEFDLVGYVRALRSLGYHGPWGVEVLSAELRALPIEEAFDRAARTTNALLSAAGAAP